MDLRRRWFDTWRALGLAGNADLLQELLHRYNDARRKYHTLQHLEECFGKLDELQGLAELSAAEVAGRVHALVMATRHAAEPRGMDQQVLIDVDLSILGADARRFDEYETQVRAEYRWVPKPIYRRRRAEILRSFLERPTIYSTAHFVERYEQQARANLQRSLGKA